ncbi:hypothetical protein [Sinosporangium siamense]|uniref:Uncharacterized protein n=1 Tax=Sinosporangium siamense TaxID=1367973 RepID=A0A919RCA0_9ACTN|nr:hypothetical protein [Sinosporangium siamense]GII91258.1 hypothetical protein Ssi02_14890 [Sinosporangium siamense]
MKKGTRLLLAAASGAAVFAGGLASAVAPVAAAPKCVGGSDITKLEVKDAFVPFKTDNKVTVTATVKDLWKKADGKWSRKGGTGTDKDQAVPDLTKLAATITKVGNSTPATLTDFQLPAAPTVTDANERAESLGTASVTTTFTITKDDKHGKWVLQLTPTRGSGSAACDEEIAVDPVVAVTGALISPNPVTVKSGDETKVSVKAEVNGVRKDAGKVTARLVSDTTDEYYDLGELETRDNDGIFRGSAYMDGTTTTGDWTLEVVAKRGDDSIKGTRGFTVVRGAASKLRSSIVFKVTPRSLKAGKYIKAYGTVYRGYSPWKSKLVNVYFKSKGGDWRLVTSAGTTKSGKFAKKIKAKRDGYYRVKVAGTSRTYGKTSRAISVNVR